MTRHRRLHRFRAPRRPSLRLRVAEPKRRASARSSFSIVRGGCARLGASRALPRRAPRRPPRSRRQPGRRGEDPRASPTERGGSRGRARRRVRGRGDTSRAHSGVRRSSERRFGTLRGPSTRVRVPRDPTRRRVPSARAPRQTGARARRVVRATGRTPRPSGRATRRAARTVDRAAIEAGTASIDPGARGRRSGGGARGSGGRLAADVRAHLRRDDESVPQTTGRRRRVGSAGRRGAKGVRRTKGRRVRGSRARGSRTRAPPSRRRRGGRPARGGRPHRGGRPARGGRPRGVRPPRGRVRRSGDAGSAAPPRGHRPPRPPHRRVADVRRRRHRRRLHRGHRRREGGPREGRRRKLRGRERVEASTRRAARASAAPRQRSNALRLPPRRAFQRRADRGRLDPQRLVLPRDAPGDPPRFRHDVARGSPLVLDPELDVLREPRVGEDVGDAFRRRARLLAQIQRPGGDRVRPDRARLDIVEAVQREAAGRDAGGAEAFPRPERRRVQRVGVASDEVAFGASLVALGFRRGRPRDRRGGFRARGHELRLEVLALAEVFRLDVHESLLRRRQVRGGGLREGSRGGRSRVAPRLPRLVPLEKALDRAHAARLVAPRDALGADPRGALALERGFGVRELRQRALERRGRGRERGGGGGGGRGRWGGGGGGGAASGGHGGADAAAGGAGGAEGKGWGGGANAGEGDAAEGDGAGPARRASASSRSSASRRRASSLRRVSASRADASARVTRSAASSSIANAARSASSARRFAAVTSGEGASRDAGERARAASWNSELLRSELRSMSSAASCLESIPSGEG